MTPLNPQQSVLDRIKAKVYAAYEENSHGLSGREIATVTGSQARTLLDELHAELCPALDADVAAEIEDLKSGFHHSEKYSDWAVHTAIDRAFALGQRQSAQPGYVERVEAKSMEYGWVIEHHRSPVHSPEYWVGNGWDRDHLRAIRFARKDDAQRSLDGFDEDDPLPGEQPHRIAEHGWGPTSVIRTPATSDKEARVKEEHKCDVCSIEIRNLFAVAHNAVNAIDAAKRQEGSWERAYRKVEQLRHGVEMMQPIMDAHFAEVNKSVDPAIPHAPPTSRAENDR